jgi:hypothetical protein
MSDLVELARKYVTLSDSLEAVRSEIKRAVLNGGGEKPEIPFSRPARPSSGSKPAKPSKHPNALAAAEAEAKIVALLRSTPGMRPVEIAKAMAARPNTILQRLQRMQERGQVERDAQGVYAASP